MAKKIRFPLQMNGTDVRTIEELRENFDLSSVLGYLTNGKLVTWLEDRYYDNEAMAVRALSTDEADLNQKLMSILGVSNDVKTEEIDLEAIQRRNEKLVLLSTRMNCMISLMMEKKQYIFVNLNSKSLFLYKIKSILVLKILK